MLLAAGEGLELLSLGGGPPEDSPPPDPLEPFRRDPARLAFMEPESLLRVTLSSSSRAERNAESLNAFTARLFDLAAPDELPAWHRLQLASFFRRAAASGYLPPEEERAYFRLALRTLSGAEALLRDPDADGGLLPFVLSERGLALAESGLSLEPAAAAPSGGAPPASAGTPAASSATSPAASPPPSPAAASEALEAAANALWDEADALRAGASGYARARWAAWSGGRGELGPHLAHGAADEDSLLWPRFREAVLEPSFRDHKDKAWFKALWFGYSR
jgi:hypothetical protein